MEVARKILAVLSGVRKEDLACGGHFWTWDIEFRAEYAFQSESY